MLFINYTTWCWISNSQEECLQRLQRRIDVPYDSSIIEHQVPLILLLFKSVSNVATITMYTLIYVLSSICCHWLIAVRETFNALIVQFTHLGCPQGVVECCISWRRASWLDIWAVEGNGLARERSINRF